MRRRILSFMLKVLSMLIIRKRTTKIQEYITVYRKSIISRQADRTGAFFRGCLSISERCQRKCTDLGGVNRRWKINDRGGEAKLNCIRA